jgi:type IV pilus assembly protein PilN
MANINLLPWREELRQERQRQFISVLGLVALLAVALMGATYTVFDSKLENQRTRNQFLQGEIRKLDSKIKEIKQLEQERADLVERMNIIQDLQKSRPQVVHIFDEIVAKVPEGVNFSSIKRVKNTLTFDGITESSPRISKFLRNLEASKWIKNGDLKDISPDKKSGANRKHFVLVTEISSPLNEQEVE